MVAAVVVVAAGVTTGLIATNSSAPLRSSTAPQGGTGPKASTPASPSGKASTVPTYQAGGWPFVASFPSHPAVSRVSTSLMRSKYTATVYSAVTNGSDVTVGVYPFPLGVPKMSANTFLRTFVSQQGVRRVTGALMGSSQTFQGLPAVSFAQTSNGGNMADFGTVVLDGHVAYVVLVSGPATTVTSAFQHALRSFRIVDPARGIVKY